jgi:hypothetical protein
MNTFPTSLLYDSDKVAGNGQQQNLAVQPETRDDPLRILLFLNFQPIQSKHLLVHYQ